MELKWVYDPATRISKTQITENLYYTTNDGGQTIKKYVNGLFNRDLHKYGPTFKSMEICNTGLHIDSPNLDEWADEVKWLAATYPNIVGELLPDWDQGFLNRNGELEDIGKLRGQGVVSKENPISVNRICQPASIQEMWDYDCIAYTDESPYEDCLGTGLKWMKHKETGTILRLGGKQVPFPCCVFPIVHGPYEVDESDIEAHNGIRLI